MSLKQRIPLLRWSFWRLAAGTRNITTTGQIGDGREAAAVAYVLKHARAGEVDDVLATIDRFAYEESLLINVGDEKGAFLDAAVQRANPKLALELGTYCGYGALRIARSAPAAKVCSVELAEANAANARQIWAHAGVADRITCVVGTIGDGGHTLDALAGEHGFSSGAVDSCSSTTTRTHISRTYRASSTAAGCIPGRSSSPTTSSGRARQNTANTCASSKASNGAPPSTRRRWSTRTYSPTWCWTRST